MMLDLNFSVSPRRAGVYVLMVVFLIMSVGSSGAQVQSAAELKYELDRLKQDLNDVQRYVFQGQAPEKIPDLADASASRKISGQLQAQIQRMTQDLRKLNGRLEEAEFQITTLTGRLDRLITDVDYRLRTIESQLSGQPVASQTPGDAVDLNFHADVGHSAPGETGNQSAVSPDSSLEGTPTTIITSQGITSQAITPQAITPQGAQIAPGGDLLPGQKSLGQLTPEQLAAFSNGKAPGQPENLPAATPAPPAEPAPALKAVPSAGDVTTTASAAPEALLPRSATPKEQYKNAINLLNRRDYDSAEVALKQFMEANPGDSLAGNAIYWLGETYYARADYRKSAQIFAQSYSRYPEGAKLTDSLLKLAMSLEAIDQIEAACTSYRALLDEHKEARQRILSIAEKAVGKLRCP